MLRRTDIVTLAHAHGIATSVAIAHDLVLRQTLAAIGVTEPQRPPEPPDGVLVLRRFRKWVECAIEDTPFEQLESDDFSRNPVPACRRATERLLKLVLLFLHDGGLADTLNHIWLEGLYDFGQRKAVHDLPTELLRLEVGPLNHLLRATSRAIEERAIFVPYLSRDAELWPGSVFGAVSALANDLNAEVHDSDKRDVGSLDLLRRQKNRVEKVLRRIETKEIRVPELVQFFRRYTDGHAVHFEGFSHDGRLVRCFETAEYQLHQPYLMCAATNPASVDMMCVPFRSWFLRPV